MAEIRPMKALRFDCKKAGAIETLTCPPYDIISEEQRQAYLDTNPNNVIRLELPKGQDPYGEAQKTLKQWDEEGILKQDEKPALYIYEEEFEARGKRKRVKGFICQVKLEEFSKGIVLPHEETLSKAKEDRFNLMKNTFCNFSQIYSLYMDDGHQTRPLLDRLSQGCPEVEMTDENGIIHRLWIVEDPETTAVVCAQFAQRKLYIADGHHRYETALNFRNWCREQGMAQPGDGVDYVMMMLVDMEHEGLVVFPTHRLVRGLQSFDQQKVLEGCRAFFDVEEKKDVNTMEQSLDTLYQKGEKAFGFYCGGDRWTQLILKKKDVLAELLPGKSKALQELDVTVLHTLVLERILGIDAENMAKQINLTYTKFFDEAIAEVADGNAQCSFILNPTRVSEIRDVAAAGEKMPQKSTYFYPKLITGLVMNRLK